MKPTLLLCCILLSIFTHCQTNTYWQQQVNYQISVSLDVAGNSLDGSLQIEYFNNSPDSLHFIWIHLWPNAYKNDKTAFTDQALENGNTDFYFSDEKDRGYINRLDFKVNDVSAGIEDHPLHQDIIKLILPQTLAPGNKANIKTPFHVKLPYNFSRGGHVGQSYQVTQWYPKPAVYDRKGWHPIPYLDQGEFYSEFGNYKVAIHVPEKYIVAATGELKNQSIQDSFKTLNFEQDSIHDFAWFADKDFLLMQDTLRSAGRTIQLYAYHFKKSEKTWANSINYIKNAIRTKNTWLGEYPYNVVSVVEKPGKDAGGMEYPTIALISTPGDDEQMDFIINHEVGHNWFYGILATNERLHPWMDEGMNSYYDRKYNLLQYGHEGIAFNVKNNFINKRLPDDPENLLLRAVTYIKKDQPIETTSEKFSSLNYNLVPYTKSAQWMQTLENEMGSEAFDVMMKMYYQRWKFRHPYPEDFKSIAEEIHHKDLDSIFALLHSKGSLKQPAKKDLRLFSFFNLKDTEKHSYIFISPAVGYNLYDKVMVGLFIHNYTLPLNKLQFILAPLFATGSKELNGLGRVGYTFYPGKNGQKLEVGLAAAKFTANIFTDSINTAHYLDFSKIVPSLKFTFANNDPRSTMNRYIQFKSFIINERSYLFTLDTSTQVYDITYPVSKRYIQQLNLVIENNRKLYPYSTALQIEKGNGFIKTNVTACYYFNYAKGGGLNARFFAGKFFYTGNKISSKYNTFRYHYNMTGANGYEDYTYGNYFIGRNEFDGGLSQQIMIKDGGFKVRTDLLSNKFGRSDDWLSALNLTTDIPKSIIPLPLKLFADIGTYAEAWKKDAQTGKFIYDGGVQLSLLKNIINIYIPVVYSKVYRDYFKSYVTEKKFRKNISFSIDVQNISFRKLIPQSPF